MPQVQAVSKTVQEQELRRFVSGLLVAAGLSEPHARIVSDCLVHANLRGIDSHGVARLPHYLQRIEGGSINPRPALGFERLAPAAGRLDADHALGHLAMDHAADRAIELAREAGAGWVALANSSHCGALSFFGLKIAEAGMIGLAFTHVDPMVIPFGAAEPFCGTNPICIAAPGPEGQSLCLDMATSVTPWNSIANAAMEGVPIPTGWAVDEAGQETTDPNQVRAVMPVGGYKGSGLGLMIDVLCAMLSNSPFGPNIPRMYGDPTEQRRLGGLIGAIDIRTFLDPQRFEQRIGELLQQWSALRPSTPGQRVLWPGEPELITARHRARHGIPLGVRLIEQFDQLADAAGLAPLNGHD